MIFERRAYTLKPGNAGRFWELQRQWNTPEQIPGLLARNIGYFSTISGPVEQVIHLYRFDSLDDWKSRLFGVYTPDRADYFAAGRSLMLAQENTFLSLAPLPEVNPIWADTRDWLPGEPAFRNVGAIDAIVVVEESLDLVPGGLPAFWDALRSKGLQAGSAATSHLIAYLYTLVGVQHRVTHYRWYDSIEEAEAHRVELEMNVEWNRFVESYRDLVVRSRRLYMKPSPVNWMRSLFSSVSPRKITTVTNSERP